MLKSERRPSRTVATEPQQRVCDARRAREAMLCGDASPILSREVVSDSWRRSLAAHVNPERPDPKLIFEQAEVDQIREGHPLAAVVPLVRGTLVSIAEQPQHLLVVTDAQGLVLWREGQRDVLRVGDALGLTEGICWAEDSTGTNAMGTALAAERAVEIYAAEHLVGAFDAWACAACPVRDPDSGEVIGTVDITGPGITFNPLTLPFVVAAAQKAEASLLAELVIRDYELFMRIQPHPARLGNESAALLTSTGRVLAVQSSGGWQREGLPTRRMPLPVAGKWVELNDGSEGVLEPLAGGCWLLRHRAGARPRSVLALSFLGAAEPYAWLDGRPVALTLRHAELLTLLALHPEGLIADELATALYGDAGKAVTVRSEVSRLRKALNSAVLGNQPYRLQTRLDADFLDVRAMLANGRVSDAVHAYRGPLLPQSEAPAVREERNLLTAAVRSAVLSHGDIDAKWAFAGTPDGAHDTELTERLLRTLPDRDPRHAALTARRTTLAR